MSALKSRYVRLMQGLGRTRPIARFSDTAAKTEMSSLSRWVASLFAIYDTERMIQLDLPWWNVAATREIEAFLARRTNPAVFEYGAGASTVWLAKRSTMVHSVEHDGRWLGKFRKQLEGHKNVTLIHCPLDNGPDRYVHAIDEVPGAFDLIVIDGRARARCLNHAKGRLKAGGIVLFDDSGRSRYQQALQEGGLIEDRHFGRSFCVPYFDHTSLLSMDG